MQKNIPSYQQLRTFSKTDHMLHSKANFHRYEKVGVTLCILLDQQGLKLELNNNNTIINHTNSCKLKSKLLNHPWVKEVIKKEIKDFQKLNKNEATKYPNLWDTMKEVLRGKFIAHKESGERSIDKLYPN